MIAQCAVIRNSIGFVYALRLAALQTGEDDGPLHAVMVGISA